MNFISLEIFFLAIYRVNYNLESIGETYIELKSLSVALVYEGGSSFPGGADGRFACPSGVNPLLSAILNHKKPGSIVI